MQATNREPLSMTTPPIIIRHNFTPDAFMWLWAKYAVDFNECYHCTNCLRGRYSHRFSKTRNPHLATDHEIIFDEYVGHRAVYICGVSRKGYSGKTNYIHNVHLPIEPAPNVTSQYFFEDWHVRVENGRVVPVPSKDELSDRFANFADSFTSCRIFRWAATALASV
jgi:hypothetical protein